MKIIKKLLIVILLLLIPYILAFQSEIEEDLWVSGILNVTNKTIKFPEFASCNLDTDANGLLVCGTDSTGSVTPGTALNVTNLNASGRV